MTDYCPGVVVWCRRTKTRVFLRVEQQLYIQGDEMDFIEVVVDPK